MPKHLRSQIWRLTGTKSRFSFGCHSKRYSVMTAPLLLGSVHETTALCGDLQWISGWTGASGTPAPVTTSKESDHGPAYKNKYTQSKLNGSKHFNAEPEQCYFNSFLVHKSTATVLAYRQKKHSPVNMNFSALRVCVIRDLLYLHTTALQISIDRDIFATKTLLVMYRQDKCDNQERDRKLNLQNLQFNFEQNI